MRRFSLLPLLALAVVPLVAAKAQVASAQRPNVVLIITDDVGYGDLGSYGAPDIRTPNIDSLARDGVRLTDFYANGATCTPTRAGLISGRYQQRYGIEAAARRSGPTDAERGLPATGRSLPQLLKNPATPPRSSASGTWDGRASSARAPTASTTSSASRAASSTTTSTRPARSPLKADLFENDRAVQDAGLHDGPHHRAVRAIHRAERRASRSSSTWRTTPPTGPTSGPTSRRWRATTRAPWRRSTIRRARARTTSRCSSAPIRASAEILAALDRLGLRQNTIVIFTNDNGGEWLSRNAPLFHRKGTVWEGGIRVPAIIRWPGRIPAGRRVGPGGHHDGPDGVDSRRDGRAGAERDAPRRHQPVSRARRTRAGDRADAVLARHRRSPQQRGPRGRLEAALRRRAGRCSSMSARILGTQRSDRQQPEIARRLAPLVTAWQEDVDGEAQRSQP